MNAIFKMRVFFELAFFVCSCEIDIWNIAEMENRSLEFTDVDKCL
jgi:hypothetical protein